MNIRKYRYFVGDFETTVYKGQTHTEVWASASVELFTEDVHIFHSIDEQFQYFVDTPGNICVYYHNLKFDGSFWLSFLISKMKYKEASMQLNDNINSHTWLEIKRMKNNTFSYSVSNLGQWYRIVIKVKNKIIEIRDSLKLLPFSVKRIAESFKTKHKKLEMEYVGFRYAGCPISDKEKEYIANDVLVVKEALEIAFNEGHNRLTIGACCLAEFKASIGRKNYERLFPDVYSIPIDDIYVDKTAGDWIKHSYRGGWCYAVKEKTKKLLTNGTTADVNSLYPSMMSSESGNKFPVGKPTFWTGNYIPEIALRKDKYYFIRIKTRFYLKDGYLPFIQMKRNLLYKPNECLITSDVWDKRTDTYSPFYTDNDGNICPARPELTLTMTDFKLLQEHYNLVDFEIVGGCYFKSIIGIFDNYIEKYKEEKMRYKGARRELAKLFLNNLYGKLAAGKNSSYKVAYLKEDKSIGFYTVVANDKKPGYVPVGSAITSYAREFTIRAAQKNFHGRDRRGFVYADTDSIHCDLPPSEIKGIRIHDKDFCCWKLESRWDIGWFVRQKTYIEHVIEEDNEVIENPYYNIKCAGMPENCKNLFMRSMVGDLLNGSDIALTDEEKEFLKVKREITDFDVGLTIPGKLVPKRIPGGVLLVPTTYEMRRIG